MRKVEIEPITRVEGHGKIQVYIKNDKVERLNLSMIESPRLFEKFLEGQPAEDAPRIAARVCGICYAAHSLASVKAVEAAWDVEVPVAAVKLRRLMHLGGYIHSHILHLAFLALPDLIDISERNVLGVYSYNPKLVETALKIRYTGQRITEAVGGRSVHPVAIIPGGLSKGITEEVRTELLELAVNALELSRGVASILFKLVEDNPVLLNEYPKLKTYYVGLTSNGAHEIYEGKIRAIDSKGAIKADFYPKEYLNYIRERTMSYSYVKHPYLKFPDDKKEMYRVGCLARLNVSDKFSTPIASELLDKYRSIFGRIVHNAAAYNVARAVELVNSTELAIELLKDKDI